MRVGAAAERSAAGRPSPVRRVTNGAVAPPAPAPRTPPLPRPPVPPDDGPTGPAAAGPAQQHTVPYRPLDQGAPAPGFGTGWESLPSRIDTGPGPGPDRRRTAAVAAAVVLVLLAGAAVVAGVLPGAGSAQDPPTSAESPDGAAAGGSPGGADLAAGATVVDGAAFGTYPLRFRSPTGNIGCVLGADGARCDVTEREWQLPPAPADCTLDWGAGLSLAGTAPAGPTCGRGTVA
ncbi:MAG: hypothetical protein L0I76_22275, partial [Pseudonocardia sp.]|nr:hypothetical protein [Pseudonocardia sp.]